MAKGDTSGTPRRTLANRRAVTVAHAHTGTHSYVWVEVRNSHVVGAVEFPVIDAGEVLGLAIPSSREEGTAFVEANLAQIADYADTHLSIGGNGQPWPLHFTAPRVFEHSGGGYVHVKYQASNGGLRPEQLTVSFDGIIEAKPDHDAELIVRNGTGWGRLQRFEDVKLPIDKDHASHTVSLTKPSWASNLAVTLFEGARRAWKRLRTSIRR